MKPSLLNPAVGLLATLATLSPAWASLPPPICQDFQGTLVLTADPVNTCAILNQPDTRWQFPDVLSTFIPNVDPWNPTCFTGAIEGTLNGQPVTGISYSGQIANPFPDLRGLGQLAFAAATTLVLKNQANQLLGRLYFRDTGLLNLSDLTASEQLAAIAGTGQFWSIKGTVTIVGNEFMGAPVTGRFCR
jgi:hypothetical protein